VQPTNKVSSEEKKYSTCPQPRVTRWDDLFFSKMALMFHFNKIEKKTFHKT
jgi:hypothetical protein